MLKFLLSFFIRSRTSHLNIVLLRHFYIARLYEIKISTSFAARCEKHIQNSSVRPNQIPIGVATTLAERFTSYEVDGPDILFGGDDMGSVKVTVRDFLRLKATKAMQALCLCFGVFLVCVPLFSQGNQGRITGTITDQTAG